MAPAGTYVDVPGALAPTPCPLGSYGAVAGSVSCVLAPVGFYVDTTGSTAPTQCPALTTTAATGSTSSSACVGIVPASLVLSITLDPATGGNLLHLSGAGLKPSAPLNLCDGVNPCVLSGRNVASDGTVDIIFAVTGCPTNTSFTSTSAAGAPIASNAVSYVAGTPGCP